MNAMSNKEQVIFQSTVTSLEVGQSSRQQEWTGGLTKLRSSTDSRHQLTTCRGFRIDRPILIYKSTSRHQTPG